jgi:branched-chain amino acid transport system substrate-binding protein
MTRLGPVERRRAGRQRLVARALAVATMSTVLGLTVAACGSDESGSAAGGGETYTVGVQLPMTGPAAFSGVETMNGINVALDEINGSGVLGKSKLAVDLKDTRGDIPTEVSYFKQFASSDHIAVICCGLSPVASAVNQLAVAQKVPTVLTAPALPGLTKPPYVYRTIFDVFVPGSLMSRTIDAVKQHEDPKTAAIIVSGDNDAFKNTVPGIKSDFERNGIKVVAEVTVSEQDLDFSGPAASVVAKDPDIVVPQTVPSGQVVRALRQQGFEGTVIGGFGIGAADKYDAGGKALEGTIFAPIFTEESTLPAAKKFSEAYRRKYGPDEQLSYFAALGYQIAHFITDGIKNGGTDREKLAAELNKIKTIDSVLGKLDMKNGDATLNSSAPVTFLKWNADGSQSVAW